MQLNMNFKIRSNEKKTIHFLAYFISALLRIREMGVTTGQKFWKVFIKSKIKIIFKMQKKIFCTAFHCYCIIWNLNVVIFKFKDQCIIPELKLSLHGMIIRKYRIRIELILLEAEVYNIKVWPGMQVLLTIHTSILQLRMLLLHVLSHYSQVYLDSYTKPL